MTLKKIADIWLLFFTGVFTIVSLKGQTPISSISTSSVTTGLATSSYVATSPSDASGGISPSTSYTVNYGQVRNLFPTSYVVSAVTYDRFVLPDTLIIQRTDAGRQLIIFYEHQSTVSTTINLQPEQVDNEDALYQTGFINAGYDNILVNSATNFANVERIDVIYYSGVLTSAPGNAVFPIVERGGNDDIKVAAIRGLDASGTPNDYYPNVIRVLVIGVILASPMYPWSCVDKRQFPTHYQFRFWALKTFTVVQSHLRNLALEPTRLYMGIQFLVMM
jgi:hypothetical protein